MTEQTAYAKLIEIEKSIGVLYSLDALCAWDEATYLPNGGVELRGQQKAWLAREIFEKTISKKRFELLEEVEASALDADPKIKGNLREIRKSYERATKIPVTLVEALAVATTRSRLAWEAAREKNDMNLFAKELKEILRLKREEAKALSSATDADSLYDVLMDPFEPGASTKQVREMLTNLKGQLTSLLEVIRSKAPTVKNDPLVRKYPIPLQRELALKALGTIGFDLEKGRLDVTTHPFCNGLGPSDVRLTTRYAENDFADCFFSVLHEGGHGLYEQSLSPSQIGLASGRACSMGIHESQSRFWENIVGRSEGFWEYFFPLVQNQFPGTLNDVSWMDFYTAANQVKNCFIRVDSDEVSYNLHIILRFEIEQELIAGTLEVEDLPDRWNQGYRSLFGVTPPTNREGCLQDVHWSLGAFGYFPTYALGNLYSAQFAEGAEKALGPLGRIYREGKFAKLKEWLTTHIHVYGQALLPAELCLKATGKPLSPEPFMKYLRKKYGALYNF